VIFEAAVILGAVATTVLTIATVLVVYRDRQADRVRARRADQFLGALYDNTAWGRPWRSTYPAARPATPPRVSVGARTGGRAGDQP
jgi:hypothetical protein